MQNFVRVFFEIGMSFEQLFDVCGGKQTTQGKSFVAGVARGAVGLGICLDLS
jgi:Na+-translocating ferredoxin:NAD+ oxidoreductase RnfC subunit